MLCGVTYRGQRSGVEVIGMTTAQPVDLTRVPPQSVTYIHCVLVNGLSLFVMLEMKVRVLIWLYAKSTVKGCVVTP